MKLRIAITGSFGNKDIGDEAMLTEDLAFMREDMGVDNEDILLLGHQPDYMATYHHHPRAQCHDSSRLETNWRAIQESKRWLYPLRQIVRPLRGRPPLPSVDKELLTLLKSSQVVLITGGGTINTREPAGNSIRRMHAMVRYFHHLGLPIFMSGQTIGPLGIHDEHDRMAREIVETVDVLTVRDHQYSRRYLDIIGAEPRQFLETFDDAYTLTYQNTPLPEAIISWFHGHEVAALNVTDYTADDPVKRSFIARLAEQLLEHWVDRLIFVSHHPNDLSHLHIIRDMLTNSVKDRVLVPDTRHWQDRQLKKIISLCRFAVGGRYHFIVFAGTSNTPFVGMSGNHYSYIKQDGFARQLGLENFILTEKETWDMDAVLDRVKQARSLSLDMAQRFQPPSASMELFRQWLSSVL
jgi:polysaccharide pyruvyl transferase WcaK-like protein